MEKIKINLQNCYGIKNLKKDFDFSQRNTYAIYAPNGAMKTSFAKTFKDLSDGVDSKDLMFPKRKTVREIKKEDGSNLTKEQVFVIESYNEGFNSEKMSTLLVNEKLKNLYDKIHKLTKKKKTLLRN